ncbi:MAG: flagellum-specific ATP synthase FliI, partial [Acidobacteria bacterium]|nr:flagellum-specific ATP synthase FliI [Acidobacteriota bacterium]
MSGLNIQKYEDYLAQGSFFQMRGRVTDVAGMLLESDGPAAAIGDFCEVRLPGGRRIRAQVIGFRNGKVLSMPLEDTGGLS